MFTGALAAVVGLTPVAAFAHGGGDSSGRQSFNSSKDRHSSNNAVQASTQNNNSINKNDFDKHHGHGGNYDAQKWWGQISADRFQKMHEAKLAKLDAVIANNHLVVENGDSFRAEVVTNAGELNTNLMGLEQLRASIDKNNITDEQKAAMKTQTLTTFESFYDYYESLYSFKAAIKTAADSSGAKTDVNVEKED